MSTAVRIGRQALHSAARELVRDAESPKRAGHFKTAYEHLKAAEFDFDGSSLTVRSASEPGKTYRVVGINCHCEGWKHREQCWHSDAFRIVNRASQIMDKERKAAAAELWG